MKKLTLIILLVIVTNVYSQICLDCPKDTLLKRINSLNINYDIQIYKDSIYCKTFDTNLIGESYYYLEQDTCYKQVFIQSIEDSTYVNKKLEEIYCVQAFFNTWLYYNYRTNKTEMILKKVKAKKYYITFSLIKDPCEIR